MRLNVYEVFDLFQKAPTREAKIRVLRENNSYELTAVLKGTFHPNIKYTVNNLPAYKPSDSPAGMAYSNIQSELNRVYLFESNNKKQEITAKRAIEILIQMLESMEAREAKVFGGMLTKNLNVPGLDYAIVKEAFPGMLPDLPQKV